MDTHEDPSRKRGQDIQKEHGRIRIHEDTVRAVEEDDVAAGEGREKLEVDALQRVPYDRVT